MLYRISTAFPKKLLPIFLTLKTTIHAQYLFKALTPPGVNWLCLDYVFKKQYHMILKNITHEFQLLALWPLSSNLTSQCLSFLLCKYRISSHRVIEKIEQDTTYKSGLKYSWNMVSPQYMGAIFLSKIELNSLVLWSQPSMKLRMYGSLIHLSCSWRSQKTEIIADSLRPKALYASYASGQDLKGRNQSEVSIQSILGSLPANTTLEMTISDSWLFKGNLAEAATSWAGSLKVEAMHSYGYPFFLFPRCPEAKAQH